jgi:long-subunit acyl-CoA synthetase (AMP-forming)
MEERERFRPSVIASEDRRATLHRAVGAATIAEAFRITAEDHPDRVAVRTKDDEVSLTWSALRERVDALAGGLARLGVRRGDTVALLLSNRPEFHLADLAAMTLGATPFSIYATSSPEQVAYVVGDAAARVAVTEEALLPKLLAAREQLPGLEHVIVVEGASGDGTVAWADVEGSDPGFDAEAHWRAVEPDDLITLIYTSGTTGPPKGVQLVHRNLMAAVESVEALIGFPDASRVISWLPAAHIAERMAHHYLPIVYAMTVTTCPNPREVVGYLPAVRPTWFFSYPRVWEKLKAGMEGFLSQGDDAERNRAWLDAATRRVELEQAGEPVPDDLAATVAEADRELFAGLRAMLGLDQAASVNVGAAPTPRQVLVFFHAIGVPLAELWGMSETCGAGCCNPPERIKIGTVGPAAPGVEVRLGDDDELLVRSEVVMTGYRHAPDKTAEALDDEGWLHTGDIAAIDEDGYVRIVDRKKEIIISSAGKNMSPANIESTLKGASPLIGQACVIGDGRPFNTALIVLDADFAPAWAAQHGVEGADLAALAHDERVRAAVQQGIDAANARLARVEQIKAFVLVEGDWAPGGDELTPTMKLKRKPIAAKYEAAIEALYAG